MRTSDMKRLGEAWASVTSKKQEGYTEEEIRELCHSKDHNCAITVNHPEWGLGKPIYESHAIPTDDGFVEWYDVQFKHGIEKRVPVADMEVIEEANHMKKKKTETEDASNDQEDDGEGMDKVDPKAAKKKFKDRKDKDIDNDGDVDDSDEYLHKRRKAIGKAMAKEEYEIYETNEYEAALELTEDSGTKYYTVVSKRTGKKYSGIVAKDPAAAVASIIRREKGSNKGLSRSDYSVKAKSAAAQKDAEDEYIDRKGEPPRGLNYKSRELKHITNPTAADKKYSRDQVKRAAARKKAEISKIGEETVKEMFRDYTVVHTKTGRTMKIRAMTSNDAKKQAAQRSGGGASRYSGTSPSDFHVENSKQESYQHESTELIKMLETAAKQQKSNATKPEEIMDKESPKSKEFANAHKKSDKKIEDNEEDGHDKTFKAASTGTKPKSGKRPQDNAAGDTNVVKSTEAPVKGVKEDIDMDAKEGSVSLVDMARDILSGKTMSELRQELKQDDSKNPYDGRLKTAKGFLERMNKRRGYEKKDEK